MPKRDRWSCRIGPWGISHIGAVTVANAFGFAFVRLGEIGTLSFGERIIRTWDRRPQEYR